jgi:hypothetical protein
LILILPVKAESKEWTKKRQKAIVKAKIEAMKRCWMGLLGPRKHKNTTIEIPPRIRIVHRADPMDS